MEIHLSGGNCHDAPQGRISIETIRTDFKGIPILMDRAYEGDKTRELALFHGHEPVVPPKRNRGIMTKSCINNVILSKDFSDG